MAGRNKPPICGWYWLTEPPDRGNAYRNAYYHYCQLPKDHEGDHVCKDGRRRVPTRPKPRGEAERSSKTDPVSRPWPVDHTVCLEAIRGRTLCQPGTPQVTDGRNSRS